jgi:hypothetical protein
MPHPYKGRAAGASQTWGRNETMTKRNVAPGKPDHLANELVNNGVIDLTTGEFADAELEAEFKAFEEARARRAAARKTAKRGA